MMIWKIGESKSISLSLRKKRLKSLRPGPVMGILALFLPLEYFMNTTEATVLFASLGVSHVVNSI
jgi:hypothetical protein